MVFFKRDALMKKNVAVALLGLALASFARAESADTKKE
ncbi:MAG: hypothetical protein ACI9I0_001273 [Rhodoferax sp.]|jgi:hypothetical protein